MEEFRHIVDLIGIAIDGAGVAVLLFGAIAATYRFMVRRTVESDPFRSYRRDLGKAILLALEFLVAGDIIRTVVVAPTLDNVIVLAIIVLIRTFLSASLQVELEGRWPWQRSTTA